MLTRIWTSLLLSLAGVASIAWLIALMHEKDIRPVRDMVGFFKKQPKSGRVFLGTFFIFLLAFQCRHLRQLGVVGAPERSAQMFLTPPNGKL